MAEIEVRMEADDQNSERVMNEMKIAETVAYAGSSLTGARISNNQICSNIYLKRRLMEDPTFQG